MSRIGQSPITVPQGVTVTINQNEVTVKGPKGELFRRFSPEMSITQQDGKLVVSRPSDDKIHRSLHGLTRTLLANMVEGVTKGFETTLEIVGAGYRVEKVGNNLALRVGLSHRKELTPIAGITLSVEGTNRIKVSGINKELVGEVAANIRKIRRADAYKGKGIRYANEVIHLKAGKAVGKKG